MLFLIWQKVAEEWKDFEEREKDYSGLKIQKLNIQDAEDEPDAAEGEGQDGEAPVAKNVWKVNAQDEKADEPAPVIQEPQPKAVEVVPAASPTPDEVAGVKKSAYIPPGLRKQMAAAASPAPYKGKKNISHFLPSGLLTSTFLAQTWQFLKNRQFSAFATVLE